MADERLFSILGPPEPVPEEATEAVVRSDGLAVVHAGERIRPADGAEAELEPAGRRARVIVPLTVQLGGGLGERERDELVQETLRRLREAVEQRPQMGG